VSSLSTARLAAIDLATEMGAGGFVVD
jgi:hypothetical protein